MMTTTATNASKELQVTEYDGLNTRHVLDTIFPTSEPDGLIEALDHIFAESRESRRGDRCQAVVPWESLRTPNHLASLLLEVDPVYPHTFKVMQLLQGTLFAETGDARVVHYTATLNGYGTNAVTFDMAYDSIVKVYQEGQLSAMAKEEFGDTNLLKTYDRNSGDKGLKMAMASMGVSALQSYKCDQVFKAVGVGGRYDMGTYYRLDRTNVCLRCINFSLGRIKFPGTTQNFPTVDNQGQFHVSSDSGEAHLNIPEVYETSDGGRYSIEEDSEDTQGGGEDSETFTRTYNRHSAIEQVAPGLKEKVFRDTSRRRSRSQSPVGRSHRSSSPSGRRSRVLYPEPYLLQARKATSKTVIAPSNSELNETGWSRLSAENVAAISRGSCSTISTNSECSDGYYTVEGSVGDLSEISGYVTAEDDNDDNNSDDSVGDASNGVSCSLGTNDDNNCGEDIGALEGSTLQFPSAPPTLTPPLTPETSSTPPRSFNTRSSSPPSTPGLLPRPFPSTTPVLSCPPPTMELPHTPPCPSTTSALPPATLPAATLPPPPSPQKSDILWRTIGGMFSPSITEKSAVISAVKTVLSLSGVTPDSGRVRRALQSLDRGNMDAETLTWVFKNLKSKRGLQELKATKNVMFGGPTWSPPRFKSARGIDHVLGEMAIKHKAGTKFIICSASPSGNEGQASTTCVITGVLDNHPLLAVPTKTSRSSSGRRVGLMNNNNGKNVPKTSNNGVVKPFVHVETGAGGAIGSGNRDEPDGGTRKTALIPLADYRVQETPGGSCDSGPSLRVWIY